MPVLESDRNEFKSCFPLAVALTQYAWLGLSGPQFLSLKTVTVMLSIRDGEALHTW